MRPESTTTTHGSHREHGTAGSALLNRSSDGSAGGASVRTRGAMRSYRPGVGRGWWITAFAGKPMSSASNRGNVLVLVLGTLALMSVVAAIYVAIGQSDRRTAEATRQSVAQRDVVQDVASYVGGVIRDDVFSAYPVRVGTGTTINDYTLFREAHDFPYTDFTVTSDSSAGSPFSGVPFNPAGTHLVLDVSLNYQYSVASDPWLASTEPTFLGRMDFPGAGIGLDDRLDIVRFTLPAERPLTKRWADNRDWWQISNFAPDGRFVNLHNLRNNFDVESGFGQDALGLNRISQGLSLLSLTSDGVLQATNLRVDGVDISSNIEQRRPANFTMFQRGAAFPIGQSVFALGTNGTALSWSSNEYPLYQWADADGDGIADSRWFELVDASDFNAPKNLLSSGEIRYFIAARAVDLSAMVNVNTASDQLAAAIQYLNETQAGGDNHRVVPARAGATPAEVDLRRILMNSDAAERHTQLNGTNRLSYADFEAVDADRTVGQDYISVGTMDVPVSSAISFDPSNAGVLTMQSMGAMGYAAMSEALQTGSVPGPASTGPLTPITGGVALTDASRWDSPFFRTNAETNRVTMMPSPDNFERYQRERSRRRMAWYHVNAQFSGPYVSFASAAQGGPGPNEAVSLDLIPGFELSQFGAPSGIRRFDEIHDFEAGFFGLEDLEELLTYRSVNNPLVTTRLERTLDGRLYPYSGLNAEQSEVLAIGPMRSGRSLLAERGGRDGDIYDPTQAGWPNPDGLLGPDGALDVDAVAQITLDVRQRLTTISGSRPILGGIPVADGLRMRQFLGNVSTSSSQFATIATALAPGLVSNNASLWSGLEHTETDTLFYGGRGPEAALNIAAHIAANLPVEFGRPQYQGPYTLIVDNTIRAQLDADLINPANPNQGAQLVHSQDYPELGWSAARVGGRALDLDPGASTGNSNDLLADSGEFTNSTTPFDGDIAHPVVNVYPTRSHPVITSVATFSVFNDASEQTPLSTPISSTLSMTAGNASPDYIRILAPGQDWIPNRGDFDPFNRDPSILGCADLAQTTINPAVDRTNADHIASVLAIQLTNPFDEPVTLWRNPFGNVEYNGQSRQVSDVIDIADLQHTGSDGRQVAGRSPDYFYLEYAGKYYELAEVRERIYSSLEDPTTGEFSPFDLSENEDVRDEGGATQAFESDALLNRYYPTTGGGNVDGTVTLHPISIAAGESIVVYVLSEREKHIAARFSHANKRVDRFGNSPASLEDATGEVDAYAVRAWIQRQLSSNGLRAVQIPQVSVVTGTTPAAALSGDFGLGPQPLEFGYYHLRDDDFNDPLAPRSIIEPGLPAPDVDSVKLWRSVRAEVAGSLNPNIADQAAGENQRVENINLGATVWYDGGTLPVVEQPIYRSNSLRNDQLVERFRFDGAELQTRGRLDGSALTGIPGTGYTGAFTLDELRLGDAANCPGAGGIIGGWSSALGDGVSLSSLNMGYTITTWAEIGRNAPDGVTGTEPNEVLSTLGGVPYYMLEPKDPADPMFRRDFESRSLPITRSTFDSIPSSRGARAYQLGDSLVRQGLAEADTQFSYWLFEQAGPQVFEWLNARDGAGAIAPSAIGGNTALSENIGTSPGLRNGDTPIPSSWLNASGSPTPFQDLELTLPVENQFVVPTNNPAGQIASVQDKLFGSSINTSQIDLNPRRLADLFNALGFGPRHTPYQNNSGTLERINRNDDPTQGEDHERTWLTTGEALALIMGYERTNSADLTTLDQRNRGALRIFGWEAPVAAPFAAPATDHRRVLEAGRLNPLAYAPFFDRTIDYVFDPSSTDIAFGDGLTPGMRLLESYRGLNTLAGDADSRLGIAVGTVNVNTASEATLRAIGLWTPSLARRANPSAGADPLYDYWPLRQPVEFAGSGGQTAIALNTVEEDTGLPILALPGQAQPIAAGDVLNVPIANRLDIPDIAATVAAYRDRMWGDYRSASIPGNAVTNLSANAGFDYDSFFGYPAVYPGSTGPQGWLNRNFAQPTGTAELSGRGFQTGIAGLREQPGFASLGELIAVTAPADPAVFDARYGVGVFNSGTPDQRDAIRHVLMDYLGYDTTGAGASPDPRPLGPGLESRIDIDTGEADDDANEFDERFAMANTAFNLLSVSSDYYAVYFVLHGYRRTDVEALRDDDPMLPSVARRFLMILDRTNVEGPSDSPRVLLLREVPL